VRALIDEWTSARPVPSVSLLRLRGLVSQYAALSARLDLASAAAEFRL